MYRKSSRLIVPLLLFASFSCKDEGAKPPAEGGFVSTDAQFFRIISQDQPFTSYVLFPNVDSVTTGTLNGSIAHQPLVRVSMNTVAFNVLQSGRLPAGTSFPDGSIIFKQILNGNQVVLYAVILKDRNNPLSGNGWLWAEYQPDGSTAISVTTRGSGCVSCHSREQGPQNDYVRTFERQR
ncbi:MAG: cytochrome P460 family protein [Ignavibacteriae bacterium]|nr:cytochrome P460 family protein [Ignavibacteriota bacterium]